MRLTKYWKPIAATLVLVAAAIYAVLVVREIIQRTREAEDRRASANVGGTFVEEEALLGVVWARRHHPRGADECPDYSRSFRSGCLSAITEPDADRRAPASGP